MAASSNDALLDKAEINDVLLTWGQARDRGEWDTLRACFQPDATIHIAWISDTAEEFVRRSADILAEWKEGESSKHFIGGGQITLNANRAYSRCHVNLISRLSADGIPFDWEFWGQFHDLFERREDGVWRIFKRTMVYEKDRLDPVIAGQQPDGYFDAATLESHPHQIRFLAWRLSLTGRKPVDDVVLARTEDETRLIDECRNWIESS